MDINTSSAIENVNKCAHLTLETHSHYKMVIVRISDIELVLNIQIILKFLYLNF